MLDHCRLSNELTLPHGLNKLHELTLPHLYSAIRLRLSLGSLNVLRRSLHGLTLPLWQSASSTSPAGTAWLSRHSGTPRRPDVSCPETSARRPGMRWERLQLFARAPS